MVVSDKKKLKPLRDDFCKIWTKSREQFQQGKINKRCMRDNNRQRRVTIVHPEHLCSGELKFSQQG